MVSLPEKSATVLVDVPLKSGGRRVVARGEDGLCYVLTAGPDSEALTFEQSFAPVQILRLAEAVLAGDEQAMTHPDTVRRLAAALLSVLERRTGEYREKDSHHG